MWSGNCSPEDLHKDTHTHTHTHTDKHTSVAFQPFFLTYPRLWENTHIHTFARTFINSLPSSHTHLFRELSDLAKTKTYIKRKYTIHTYFSFWTKNIFVYCVILVERTFCEKYCRCSSGFRVPWMSLKEQNNGRSVEFPTTMGSFIRLDERKTHHQIVCVLQACKKQLWKWPPVTHIPLSHFCKTELYWGGVKPVHKHRMWWNILWCF